MELAHYTSLQIALQILQDDGIHFHLSRYSDMNEPHEIAWSKRELIKLGKLDMSSEDTDYVYVLSLSKKIDDLTMWRLYGLEYMGVCLVFELDTIDDIRNAKPRKSDDTPTVCGNVIYGVDDIENVEGIEGMKDKFSKNCLYTNELMCAFVKPVDFKIEGEYRFCHINHEEQIWYCDNDSQEFTSSDWNENTYSVKVKNTSHGLVRYVEKIFPISSLKKIIVGGYCNPNTKEIISSFVKELNSEYSNVEIILSKFPLV